MYTLRVIPGKLEINDLSHHITQLSVRKHPNSGFVRIKLVSTDEDLAFASFEDYLNGDTEGNPPFASFDALIEFIDTAFNTGGGNGDGVPMVVLTQAEYDALDPVDPDTLYFIVG